MVGTQREDSSRASELLESLRQKQQAGFDIAWISRGSGLKYAISPWTRQDPKRTGHSGLDSSVVKLIEGVYASEPRWSLAWIRNRIWTTESWGVASSATVQVAARRVGWEAPWSQFFTELQERSSQELKPQELALDPDPSEGLRPVFASLQWGDLTLERSNRAKVIRTRHAEVELVRAFYAELHQQCQAAEIRVSLKCCKMCAAWIFEAFAGKFPFKVLYQEYDPGRLAQFTTLEARTPQRRQAVEHLGLEPSWIEQELESFWFGSNDNSR